MKFLLQIPTPTPLPDGLSGLGIELGTASGWDVAESAVQGWNMVSSQNEITTILQILVLVTIIGTTAYVFVTLVNYVTRD
ncbi:MAG: hypothetical protein KDA17_07050 [Candidatus Saccharibacteria bacterium]|nr:hypothetical protein [Candidatus Saccharibacteria bacterium]